MGQRIQLNKENQAVLLFSKARQKWEDKTISVSAMYSAGKNGPFDHFSPVLTGQVNSLVF